MNLRPEPLNSYIMDDCELSRKHNLLTMRVDVTRDQQGSREIKAMGLHIDREMWVTKQLNPTITHLPDSVFSLTPWDANLSTILFSIMMTYLNKATEPCSMWMNSMGDSLGPSSTIFHAEYIYWRSLWLLYCATRPTHLVDLLSLRLVFEQ